MTATVFKARLGWTQPLTGHWTTHLGHLRLHVVSRRKPPKHDSLRYHWRIDDSDGTLYAGVADTPEGAARGAEEQLLLMRAEITAELTRRR